MKSAAKLRLIEPDEVADPDDKIRSLLIQRQQALEALAWAEADLLPLRKRYAANRGEFMLPTIERLKRELLV